MHVVGMSDGREVELMATDPLNAMEIANARQPA